MVISAGFTGTKGPCSPNACSWARACLVSTLNALMLNLVQDSTAVTTALNSSGRGESKGIDRRGLDEEAKCDITTEKGTMTPSAWLVGAGLLGAGCREGPKVTCLVVAVGTSHSSVRGCVRPARRLFLWVTGLDNDAPFFFPPEPVLSLLLPYSCWFTTEGGFPDCTGWFTTEGRFPDCTCSTYCLIAAISTSPGIEISNPSSSLFSAIFRGSLMSPWKLWSTPPDSSEDKPLSGLLF